MDGLRRQDATLALSTMDPVDSFPAPEDKFGRTARIACAFEGSVHRDAVEIAFGGEFIHNRCPWDPSYTSDLVRYCDLNHKWLRAGNRVYTPIHSDKPTQSPT